jgi:hypothetical protein
MDKLTIDSVLLFAGAVRKQRLIEKYEDLKVWLFVCLLVLLEISRHIFNFCCDAKNIMCDNYYCF